MISIAIAISVTQKLVFLRLLKKYSNLTINDTYCNTKWVDKIVKKNPCQILKNRFFKKIYWLI